MGVDMDVEIGLLGEGFTLSLEQAVADLSSLELRLHETQRLSRREDSLAVLRKALMRLACVECNKVGTYTGSRHVGLAF